MPIFRWETLQEIGPSVLGYAKPSSGREYEVELIGGLKVRVWMADDRQSYFCHGLTFDSANATVGPVSPFSGEAVETILRAHYERIPEVSASLHDILVWRGSHPDTTPHSAVVTTPVIAPEGKFLDYSTRLHTKNGMLPPAIMSLQELIEVYGESYDAYRQRSEV